MEYAALVLEISGSHHPLFLSKSVVAIENLYDPSQCSRLPGSPEGNVSVSRRFPVGQHQFQNAEILIIGGTSLTVYPAAGLIDYYRGKKLVLINKTATPMDERADLVISAPIGEVFERFLTEGK